MLRLTIALTASLYAVLVIWGEPSDRADGTTTVASAAPAQPAILGMRDDAAPAVTRASFDPAALPDPAAIAAAAPAPTATQAPRLIGEPIVVNLVAPAEAFERAPEDRVGLLQVSGSRVNMRSGPSTANGVVSSLPQGTLAEPLGEPQGGWQQIREIETGRTGWMSARFLEPA